MIDLKEFCILYLEKKYNVLETERLTTLNLLFFFSDLSFSPNKSYKKLYLSDKRDYEVWSNIPMSKEHPHKRYHSRVLGRGGGNSQAGELSRL